jgi:hypothetical protein
MKIKRVSNPVKYLDYSCTFIRCKMKGVRMEWKDKDGKYVDVGGGKACQLSRVRAGPRPRYNGEKFREGGSRGQ